MLELNSCGVTLPSSEVCRSDSNGPQRASFCSAGPPSMCWQCSAGLRGWCCGPENTPTQKYHLNVKELHNTQKRTCSVEYVHAETRWHSYDLTGCVTLITKISCRSGSVAYRVIVGMLPAVAPLLSIVDLQQQAVWHLHILCWPFPPFFLQITHHSLESWRDTEISYQHKSKTDGNYLFLHETMFYVTFWKPLQVNQTILQIDKCHMSILTRCYWHTESRLLQITTWVESSTSSLLHGKNWATHYLTSEIFFFNFCNVVTVLGCKSGISLKHLRQRRLSVFLRSLVLKRTAGGAQTSAFLTLFSTLNNGSGQLTVSCSCFDLPNQCLCTVSRKAFCCTYCCFNGIHSSWIFSFKYRENTQVSCFRLTDEKTLYCRAVLVWWYCWPIDLLQIYQYITCSLIRADIKTVF